MKDDLLEEFKELIEQVSIEVLRQSHLKDVASDVITQSYKAEITQSLALIDKDIDRIRQHLKTIDYITAQEVKALLDQQAVYLKESEVRLKNALNQNARELYIANEKLQTQIDTLRAQISTQSKQTTTALENQKKWLQDTLRQKENAWIERSKKWIYFHYILLTLTFVLLVILMFMVGKTLYGF